MSTFATAWVWTLEELDPVQTLIMLALADRANDRGECWPGQKEVARKSRCSVRTMQRHLKKLEEEGYLRTEIRSTPSGRKGLRYFLNVGYSITNPAYAAYGIQAPQNVDIAAMRQIDALAREDVEIVENTAMRQIDALGEPTGENVEMTAKRQIDALGEPTGENVEMTAKRQIDALGGQSDTAMSLRKATTVSLSNTLRKEPSIEPSDPYLTLPDPKEVTAQEGTVKSGQVGLSDEETRLIAECIPHAMQTLDVEGARLIASLLSERVAAGWLPSQINAILGAGALPARVHRMAGLVAARIRANIATDASPAVLRERAHAAKRERDEQLQALTEPVGEDPLTADNAFAGDPEKQAILRKIIQENPEMTLTNAIIATTRTILARKAS